MGSEGRVDDAVAVVLARVDDRRARHVVDLLDAALPVPVMLWSHEDFFDAAAQSQEFRQWGHLMRERYLVSNNRP